MPRTFDVHVASDTKKNVVSAKLYEPDTGEGISWLILGHGAGAGQDSTFMVSFAHALAARGLHVVTFNFPYMSQGRRLPDPNVVLESSWRAVALHVRGMAGRGTLCIGGKSMGGRIASQVAAAAEGNPVPGAIDGLVFLGYPLHAPGRSDRSRVAHWPGIHAPALFIQGTRDTFGSPDEIRAELPRFAGRATLLPIEGGDHSFKVPKSAGRKQETVYSEIQDAIAAWMAAR